MRVPAALALLLTSACATAQRGGPEDPVPALPAERPGVVDVYFLGFAGSDAQPVFKNEVTLARDLAQERLGVGDRWRLHVVESLRPDDARPSTRAELFRSLDEAARVMNVEEDVLFLWLSSHGRKDHYLHVRDGERETDDDLAATELARELDARGFRWRIIVVSACFGGGFIPPLENERTIVLTAANARRPSFGCKPDRELPFFGKAVLAEEWRERPGLLSAFRCGTGHIESWEEAGGHPHSRPTAFVGDEMAARLGELEGEDEAPATGACGADTEALTPSGT